MITDVEYYQIVTEAYDLSDYATKKKVLFCNEAQKVVNIEHIANKLYNSIKSNCTSIDFGTIPSSKGVLTRVENYAQVLEALNTVKELVSSYNEKTNLADVVSTAFDNIMSRERTFTKAFALNIEFPMMIYNVSVLSCISAVSLLITSSVEYIKNGHDSFSMSFDKTGYAKSKDHVLFQYLTQFNAICLDGSLDKMMNSCVKNNMTAVKEDTEILNEFDINKAIETGAAIAKSDSFKAAMNSVKDLGNTRFGKIVMIAVGVGASIGVLIGFLKVLRRLIYHTLRLRMKVSDWFALQAYMLQINAENLKYREDVKGDEHKHKVYQSQMKWVTTLNSLSNAFALKNSKANKDLDRQDTEDSKSTYDDDDDSDDDSLF